jgi:hypothetical protein
LNTLNFQLDAVRLTGTTDNPTAVVSDYYHRVEYVPNEYMYGLDTFSYVVSDCPYRSERQSDISHVTLSLSGINNPPAFATQEFNVSSKRWKLRVLSQVHNLKVLFGNRVCVPGNAQTLK